LLKASGTSTAETVAAETSPNATAAAAVVAAAHSRRHSLLLLLLHAAATAAAAVAAATPAAHSRCHSLLLLLPLPQPPCMLLLNALSNKLSHSQISAAVEGAMLSMPTAAAAVAAAAAACCRCCQVCTTAGTAIDCMPTAAAAAAAAAGDDDEHPHQTSIIMCGQLLGLPYAAQQLQLQLQLLLLLSLQCKGLSTACKKHCCQHCCGRGGCCSTASPDYCLQECTACRKTLLRALLRMLLGAAALRAEMHC
jgi:hypothetical protein